jgi:PleD family two-component response regulator
VANRRAWDEELSRELARAARSGEQLCLALVARALYAAKEGGRNRSCADLAEAAEAAGRAQG